MTVACPSDVVTPTPPAVTDNCGRTINATLDAEPTIPNCNGQVGYNFTYTDCANITQAWTSTYTISDPVWSAPQAGSLTVAFIWHPPTSTPPPYTTLFRSTINATLDAEPTIPNCNG